MTPQMNKRVATASTRSRLFSAKSTRRRIIITVPCLLFRGALKHQRPRHYLLPRLDPGNNLLETSRQHLSSHYLDPLKRPALGGNVNPIAIVQMKNSRGWNSGSVLRVHPLECGGHEHPEAKDIVGIFNFEADLGRANIRIHDRTNTGDSALQNPIRIRVQVNVRVLSDVNGGQVVLIHVADDPYLGRIRNSEQVGRIIQALDSGRGSYVLFDDGSTHRRLYFEIGRAH